MPVPHPSPRGGVLRAVLWVVSVLLLLCVAAITSFDWFLRRQYEPTLHQFQKEVSSHVGFFCEQQALLAQDPWFHEPRPPGDAGRLLNKWLPWEPRVPLAQGSPLTIPGHLPQTHRALAEDWLTADIDVSGLDFEWMRELQAYDRWDILQNSPIPVTSSLDWANMPLPNFIHLQLWVKFRLLHGLRTGTSVEAAKDVRHLAWLAWRTDILLGGAIANALLRLERKAYDSLPTPPAEWKPMSHEQLARMRAVVMTSHVFSNLSAPVQVAKQARGCGEPAVTRCIALAETASMARYLWPVAQDRYREAYAALTEELTASSCPTTLVPTLWERGATIDDQHLPTTALPGQPEWLDTLPGAFVASHMAGILMSIAGPGLEPLKEFRKKLATGDFQDARR